MRSNLKFATFEPSGKILGIESEASLGIDRIVAPPVHHHRSGRAQEQEDEQQVQVVTRIKRSPTDVRPLVPPLVTVAVKIEVEDRSNDDCCKRPRAQVSAERGGAGEENGRVPQFEPILWEFPVQEPDECRGDTSQDEPIENRREVRRGEESLGSDQGVHDAGRVVALEILASPLARRIGLGACNVVKLGGDDPAHCAVVDNEADDVGDDLNADHIAGWDVEVVADLSM